MSKEGVNVINSLFNPESVAVIGASDNPSKLGFHVMKSLVNGGFKGTIIPVNPGAEIPVIGPNTFGMMNLCANRNASFTPEFSRLKPGNAGKKPVVAYKTGSGTVGDAAARSHTGSLAGRHEIYSDAFKQVGILVVDSTQSLLDTAKALSHRALAWRYCRARRGPLWPPATYVNKEGLKSSGFPQKKRH